MSKGHHKTLESLELSYTTSFYTTPLWHTGREISNEFDRCSPSFKCFTSVRFLKIAPIFIWGREEFHDTENNVVEQSRYEENERLWKAIPRTVEDLCIANASGWLDRNDESGSKNVSSYLLPALSLLIDRKSECFPKLNAFQIQIRFED